MKKPLKQTVDGRHEARKLALQVLFEASFHPVDLNTAAERIKQEMLPPVCDAKLVAQLLHGVETERAQIDQIIAGCAPEWPLRQLPKLDLNILRIAIYELYIAKSVPPKVAVDEAVELAKEFSEESTSSFVNGALGTVIKLREKETNTETALFIGQFQPLHRGHMKALKQIAARFPKIIIGIAGADQKQTAEQPLSYDERRSLLLDVFATADWPPIEGNEAVIAQPHIEIIPLADQVDDGDWVRQAISLSPNFSVVYTNHPQVTRLFSEAGYPVFAAQLHKPDEYSCHEVKRRIALGHTWDRLVPTKVVKFVEDQNIIERIRSGGKGGK
ncbi:MAG TPA: transcription antitermination factor NusB [bacterium]|nr:transcription antitermination factor NusB [bacterium]